MYGALIALAIGVGDNPFLAKLNRARVHITHTGAPVSVVIVARTRDSEADEWEYKEVKYLPRRLMTSPREGRRVLVTLPTTLKSTTQLCVRHTPPLGDGAVQLSVSFQSCLWLRRPTSGASLTGKTSTVPDLRFVLPMGTPVASMSPKDHL